jgi:hypothetical protein
VSRLEFGSVDGVVVDAIRQIYMMGAVWRLAQDRAGTFLNILEVGSWAKKGGAWLPVSLSGVPLSLPPYASPETLLQIKERFGMLG